MLQCFVKPRNYRRHIGVTAASPVGEPLVWLGFLQQLSGEWEKGKVLKQHSPDNRAINCPSLEARQKARVRREWRTVGWWGVGS